jgi:UDP-N-acetylglucosamine--dolichyl-phosphate N-acetylglucosaminephosphotransferase
MFTTLGILFTKAFMPFLLLSHVSALFGISFIVFLGFADDVLDLAWRYKLILPPIASLPLIVAYDGVTDIVLPFFIRPYLGNTLNLGPLYYLYMIMLSTFQTNAINIYAGVNGLEVGQSLIIACSIAIHNIIEVTNHSSVTNEHLFSLLIIFPYLFTALALFKHNHFPSKVSQR